LDLKQGSVDTRHELSAEILGDPFVAGDLLVGTSLKGDPVSAFNLAQKQMAWSKGLFAELSAIAGHSRPPRVVSAGDEIFVIGRPDLLAGCSLADGTLRWHAPIGVPYYVPNATAGRVYLLLAGTSLPARLVCIDARTGQIAYDVEHAFFELGNNPFSGTFTGTEIVFCTSRRLVVAFRLEDGSVSWSHSSREGVGRAISIDQRVLVPTASGEFLVFEPTV
jgi:outer membrane protein assembly factor BamB